MNIKYPRAFYNSTRQAGQLIYRAFILLFVFILFTQINVFLIAWCGVELRTSIRNLWKFGWCVENGVLTVIFLNSLEVFDLFGYIHL